MTGEDLFRTIVSCRKCFPAAERLDFINPDKNPDQPNEPWLEPLNAPIWAIGLEPTPIEKNETKSITLNAMKKGVSSYQALLEKESHVYHDRTLAKLRGLKVPQPVGVHNIVKCRRVGKGDTSKDKPVIQQCSDYLKTAISLGKPKAILLHGKDSHYCFLSLYAGHLPKGYSPLALSFGTKEQKGFFLTTSPSVNGLPSPGFAVVCLPFIIYASKEILIQAEQFLRESVQKTWDVSANNWKWEIKEIRKE